MYCGGGRVHGGRGGGRDGWGCRAAEDILCHLHGSLHAHLKVHRYCCRASIDVVVLLNFQEGVFLTQIFLRCLSNMCATRPPPGMAYSEKYKHSS